MLFPPKLVFGKPQFAIIATYVAYINLNSKHSKIYQFGEKRESCVQNM